MSETLQEVLIRTGSANQVELLTDQAKSITKDTVIEYLSNNATPPSNLSVDSQVSLILVAAMRYRNGQPIVPWEDIQPQLPPKPLVAGW